MPRLSRRTTNRQLDLFEANVPLPPEAMPSWTTLPDQTRSALTELMTRLLVAHASAVATPGSDGDER